MQTITKITSGIALIALGAGLAACGSGGDDDIAPPRAEAGVIVLASCLGNATADVDVVFGEIEESFFLGAPSAPSRPAGPPLDLRYELGTGGDETAFEVVMYPDSGECEIGLTGTETGEILWQSGFTDRESRGRALLVPAR